ncbi:DNA-binding HxlR family transcriptional regulator [Duganella sp. 1411]|uniref:winged helix-turn-helix transcriptional regulator n=1 Tax=Duganella sp. 1411 TaxID=2806572 RepID=UPI001B6A2842|nr:helix-turn-helix domain-containing protein [Duganella sp. 1411]MBP1204224.1 DNA-binding HxlR family transcriptional regulator [Duganella sp. 1411]
MGGAWAEFSEPRRHLIALAGRITLDGGRERGAHGAGIILCQLFAAKAPLRFSDLERLIAGVNQKMLIQQLKQLEQDGIVLRTVFAQVPPRVEYELTDMGYALGPSMQALIEWAEMRRARFTRNG